jgi:energy-coupling factor transporter ATP-binding protein EcfA2
MDRRDLLILNEPSSGLDAEAEHQIHRTLREHREGATSVISHRLGAVRDADRIAVLAHGRIAEQGTHQSPSNPTGSTHSCSGCKRTKLGDPSRWPEIFALNRAVLRHPDRILPGQTLTLPTGPAPQPQLRFYVVKPGDTLSKIAQDKLGAADRWAEIFTLNGNILTNPDVIIVDQVLQLPPSNRQADLRVGPLSCGAAPRRPEHSR